MSIKNSIYEALITNSQTPYQLLPFRNKSFPDNQVCIVNDLGEFHFLSRSDLINLIDKKLDVNSILYKELRSKNFVIDSENQWLLENHIIKYRTKKSFLEGFTKLHMLVPTLRCNHSCPYCQVSRVSEDKQKYDMSFQTADKIIDLVFKNPTVHKTIEFQGGEPLLNFPIIKYVIEEISKRRGEEQSFTFVVCTNLTCINKEILEFFKLHNVNVSTSLDGPAFLHNQNRPKQGNDSYEIFLRNLKLTREIVGVHKVSALMTTTKESLVHSKAIIDEYLSQGFKSIFLRPLNPYGFAVKTHHKIGYTTEEFFEFYKESFEYILSLNLKGITLEETFAKIILSKILSPFPNAYVDCQSPTGAGIGAVLYNHNGNVYPADEARMLAESGDDFFCMGNVNEHSYEDIFMGNVMKYLMNVGCNESLAGCSNCAYQPYCGADPINNYATQGYVLGQRYTSSRCKKHLLITTYLLEFIRKNDPKIMNIFNSWISNNSVNHLGIANERTLSTACN